jgi:putative Mg2+ transporter-C (MgtC) family protein
MVQNECRARLEVPMNEVWNAIAGDFSDLPTGAQIVRVAVRLVLAMLLGGVLGFEREHRGKQAGMRTQMMIALGAALFALIPQQAGMSEEAISRILQGMVAGIGFLGAGPILKLEQHMEVRGLTTAASVWVSAAIGMAVGLGRGMTAVLATALALVILAVLPRFEQKHGDGPKQKKVQV